MAAIRQSKGDRIFDAVNLTLMTLLMLIVLYPLVYILSASISNPDLVNRGEIWLLPKGITFEGYIRVFQDNEIMIGYRNTIFYTVAGTIVNLFFTLTAAYALSKREHLYVLLRLHNVFFGRHGAHLPLDAQSESDQHLFCADHLRRRVHQQPDHLPHVLCQRRATGH